MEERIIDAKNRVFYSDGLGIGKDRPTALYTSKKSVYRVTGYNQINDIINTGYVRPKKGKVKGGHVNEVFWSIGGEKTFYFDERPVLQIPEEKIKDGQIGAMHINDLSGIWIFDKAENRYINRIDDIRKAYEEKQLIEKEYNEKKAMLSSEESLVQEAISSKEEMIR